MMTKAGARMGQLTWAMGLVSVWVGVWALLGARFLILMGGTPHPFLPDQTYTGVMLRAVVEWALGALLVQVCLAIVSGLLCFLWLRFGTTGDLNSRLGFRRGVWLGLGTALWIHGLLYLEVPGALGQVQGFRALPMALPLGFLLGTGLGCIGKGLGLPFRGLGLLKVCGAGLSLALMLQLPHDLFRRMISRETSLPPDRPRLLILGIDGLRQDMAEAVMPAWKAPGGCQPITVVPATRLAWNILLGADPESFSHRFVIPFRSELEKKPSVPLLEEAQRQKRSTAFTIDDSTTLSFGLSRTPFDEVIEPVGGWKHFFTVGAGGCWPTYSWAENYLSPAETTNPWSDPRAFFRDIERLLERQDWVSAHTCQLHAPFFLRLKEIQKLRPWSWLLHAARSYQPYQSMEQAERDHFSRTGDRANAVNQYRIRATALLRQLDPFLDRWARRFPGLSGVLTADHGEAHLPVLTPDGTPVTYLTGIHGFYLDPDTLRVPLHPFGLTRSALGPRSIYSWLDLRDDIARWLQSQRPMTLTRTGAEGWLVPFPTVQAIHAMPKEARERGGVEGGGTRPEDIARRTYLSFKGFWAIDDLRPGDVADLRLSYALVSPDKLVTFNPLEPGKTSRQEYVGYIQSRDSITDEAGMMKEIQAFTGRHPTPMTSSH